MAVTVPSFVAAVVVVVVRAVCGCGAAGASTDDCGRRNSKVTQECSRKVYMWHSKEETWMVSDFLGTYTENYHKISYLIYRIYYK